MNLSKQLKKTLGAISREISARVSCPNNGGCCVIASCVGEYLERYVECSLRVLDDLKTQVHLDEIAFLDGKDLLDGYNSNGVYFGHVVLQIQLAGRRYYWDSTGLHTTYKTVAGTDNFHYKLYRGSLPIEIGKQLGQCKGWNTAFNRNQIPKVERLVKKHFAELDNILQKNT